MSTTAIARVQGVSWNTAARWIARGSQAASSWSRQRVRGVALRELQFDEIKVAKVDDQPNVWIYTGMEVWCRLWLSSLTGTRTYWNTYHVVADAMSRGALQGRPFVTTDAMEYYRWAVDRALEVPQFSGQARVGVSTRPGEGHQAEVEAERDAALAHFAGL